MVALLQRVASAYAARCAEFGSVIEPPRDALTSTEDDREAQELDLNLERWLVMHLRDAFDPAHGGFGRGSKRIPGIAAAACPCEVS